MLYSHISIYVERENIMLSLASNMIEKGDVSGAFVALSLIPDPSVETIIGRIQESITIE